MDMSHFVTKPFIYIYIYIYICINGLEYIANNILVNFYVKLALVNFING